MKRPGVQDIGLAVCFLLLAVIALRPSGVVGGRVREWNAERQVLACIARKGRRPLRPGRVCSEAAMRAVIFEFSDYRWSLLRCLTRP